MTDHVKFKVEIPRRWIVGVPLQTYRRLCARIDVYPDIWMRQEPNRDTYGCEGTAPREVVTLLMAAAQEHDVTAILDALDEQEALRVGH